MLIVNSTPDDRHPTPHHTHEVKGFGTLAEAAGGGLVNVGPTAEWGTCAQLGRPRSR